MIDILVERHQRFESIRAYKLNTMLRGLKHAKIPWRIIDRPHDTEGGEAAFVHVDLTDVPSDFLAAARRYTRCVNRDASTIRRTLYSRARLFPNDHYEGPVIVKTVLNSGGCPELLYGRRQTFAARLGYVAMENLIPGYKQRVRPKYKIYPSLNNVPHDIWQNPRFIVERFLSGSLNRPIVKHRFDFFYEIGLNTRVSYDSLLCDPSKAVKFDVVHEVPIAIQNLRRELSLDYGAIDYFMVGDEAIPIDANKTVTVTDSWVKRWPCMGRHLDEVVDRLIQFARSD